MLRTTPSVSETNQSTAHQHGEDNKRPNESAVFGHPLLLKQANTFPDCMILTKG
jgi:hypothetical protein